MPAVTSRSHFGPGRELLVGEVLRLHAREGLVDQDKMYVDLDAYRPIGRLFGNLYATQRDTFALARESHAQWLARTERPNRPTNVSDAENCTVPSAMVTAAWVGSITGIPSACSSGWR